MNVVGRVFLVLNLGLAGFFVSFAGQYLQRADDWRNKHTTLQTESDAEIKRVTDSLAAKVQDVNDEKRVATNLQTKLTQLEIKLQEAGRTNGTLLLRVKAMEDASNATKTFMGQVNTAIATATGDAKEAMGRAIASEKVRDAAVTAKNTADAALSAANFKIGNLEKDIQDKAATIAMKVQKINQDGVLLDLVNQRYPGIFQTIHPLVTGTVSYVGASGDMISISLESGAENLKAGVRFAIFDSSGYKGEATVRDVEKNMCFAKITLKQGKVAVGDSASTNLTRTGKGN